MNRKLLIPFAIFVALFGFLLVGLGLNPREVPSPLVGKPAPDFKLAQLHQPERTLGATDFRGQVWVLNVWASWCVACRVEHPLWVELSKSKLVPLVGLNYKDKPDDAIKWLTQLGDPYEVSVSDRDGRVAIDWGVYGVPETFVIDKAGMIRYKYIGPVDAAVIENKILPLVRELQKS